MDLAVYIAFGLGVLTAAFLILVSLAYQRLASR
jgi:hypothetical protein